jgi:hypothetical protein
MNIYERLPIVRLAEIIGEDQLTEISGILEALNRPDLNIDMVHTRGFLAKYALQVIGYKHLRSKEGAIELFTSLSDKECQELLTVLGFSGEFTNKDAAIKIFLEKLKTLMSKYFIIFHNTLE